MQKYFFTICFTLLSWLACSQNLVPNPSFEEYNKIPCNYILSNDSIGEFIKEWFQPTGGTSDFFSSLTSTSCFANPFSTAENSIGYQSPRSGNFMAAIFTFGPGCGEDANYREYLSIRLKKLY